MTQVFTFTCNSTQQYIFFNIVISEGQVYKRIQYLIPTVLIRMALDTCMQNLSETFVTGSRTLTLPRTMYT